MGSPIICNLNFSQQCVKLSTHCDCHVCALVLFQNINVFDILVKQFQEHAQSRPLQLVHGTVTRYMVPLDELEKRFIQEMMAAQKQDGHGSADGEADGNDNESVAQPAEKVNGVQDDEENLEEMDLGKEESERRGDKPDTPHESEVDNDKEDNAKEANEDDEQQQEETNAEKGPEKEDTAGEKTVDSIDLSRQGAEGESDEDCEIKGLKDDEPEQEEETDTEREDKTRSEDNNDSPLKTNELQSDPEDEIDNES